MPPLDATPEMDMPEDDPPSSKEVIADMSDERLSQAYHLASKWKAYADYAEGLYAVAEIAYAQRLSEARRTAYMRLFGDHKPANAKHGEMQVESDQTVREEARMHTAMKQGHNLYKSKSDQFSQLAMVYGSERKQRRELEMVTSNSVYLSGD